MTEINIHNVKKVGFRHTRFDASGCEVVILACKLADGTETEITIYSERDEPLHLLIGDTE